MTELYWQVGNTINEVLLGGKRAEYGAEIIQELASHLTQAYGRGWSAQQLRHCRHLARTFAHDEIFSALRRELNWTCIKTIMYIDEPLKREFYIEMCKMNNWDSRTLSGRIKSMLYERTAIAKKPDEVIANDLEQLREEGELSQDLVFRDPYFLDYLGLHGDYSERDLESAIVAELQHFITELGNDFAFLDRQKRITIDGRDYYIDLLFFHRRLRRLVAIELKLGDFEASFKGQMELYLRWLEKARTNLSVLSYVRARTTSMSSCSAWTRATSAWRNTSHNCHRWRCWKRSCAWRLARHEGGWKSR